MQKLINYSKQTLLRGLILRCKAHYPYEEVVDFMICETYDDEQFEEAIGKLWERIENFNPKVYGYEYASKIAPKMQLVPQGWRGYIEMRPVREVA